MGNETLITAPETAGMTYVSDIVGEDFKDWENGRKAIIAGTGMGKTSFIMDVLLPYAIKQSGDYYLVDPKKKVRILYLCNRRPLKQQLIRAVFGDGKEHWLDEYERLKWDMQDCLTFEYIDVMTYQKLQKDLKQSPEKVKEWLDRYTYIVCDEAHYFYDDSDFNDDTELAYMCIEQMVSIKVVIYMSATADLLLYPWLLDGSYKNMQIYQVPKQNACIDEIRFYYRDNELELLLKSIPADEKALLFAKSTATLRKLKKQFGDKMRCYCSAGNKNGAMDKLSDCIDENGKLLPQILGTTTVLYNGVDVKDRTLKHIFIEQENPQEVIQEIGRKRPLDANDTCKLYLRGIGKKQLESMKEQNDYNMQPGVAYLEGGEAWKAFLDLPDANERISPHSVLNYDHKTQTYHVNAMKMRLYQHRKGEFMKMEKYGYEAIMKIRICNQLTENVKEFRFEGLETYIKLHLNEPMPKEQLRQDIIAWGYIQPPKGRSKNEEMGKTRLNRAIKSYNVKIVQVQSWKRDENRGRTMWMLTEL